MNDHPERSGPTATSTEQTRERLLAAAARTVREHGVAGATSRLIAAAAGTNLQAITYHFGSKDDLVAQALVATVRSWVQPVREVLRTVPDDPADRLTAALALLDDTAARVADQVPAYLDALAQVPRQAGYRDQVRGLLAELRTDVEAVLAQLRSDGVLDDWVDPQAMAALVVAAADGVAVHLALDPESMPAHAVLGQVGALLLAVARPSRG